TPDRIHYVGLTVDRLEGYVTRVLLGVVSSTTSPMTSERRQATILFADISGFTAASSKLDPEDLTDIMNECFRSMETAVHDHGGHVDKFIGDCIMAIFGAPTALESGPRQAVNAAIDMRNYIDTLCRERRVPIPIAVHAGINTGLVLAGDVGGEVARSFTVM